MAAAQVDYAVPAEAPASLQLLDRPWEDIVTLPLKDAPPPPPQPVAAEEDAPPRARLREAFKMTCFGAQRRTDAFPNASSKFRDVRGLASARRS